MGYKELIKSLHSDCEDKIRQILEDAEKKKEKVEVEAYQNIETMREESNKKKLHKGRKPAESILIDADKRAQKIRLTAEKILSDRLYLIAQSSLSKLREKNYSDIFKAIVDELPSHKWHTVYVNPDDLKVARQYFPDTKIIPDKNITGGVTVETEDKAFRIVNTFEKRLERVWQDILPLLIKDVYEEIENKK